MMSEWNWIFNEEQEKIEASQRRKKRRKKKRSKWDSPKISSWMQIADIWRTSYLLRPWPFWWSSVPVESLTKIERMFSGNTCFQLFGLTTKWCVESVFLSSQVCFRKPFLPLASYSLVKFMCSEKVTKVWKNISVDFNYDSYVFVSYCKYLLLWHLVKNQWMSYG